MSDYAQSLARDKKGNTLQQFALPRKALATYAPENSSTSSTITLGANTTTLEVAAITLPAAIRWYGAGTGNSSVITIAGGTANFDNVIPVGTVRRFVVPTSIFVAQASTVGANAQNGLFPAVAVKSMGIGRVLTTDSYLK